MESSIAEFLMRQLAHELLPTCSCCQCCHTEDCVHLAHTPYIIAQYGPVLEGPSFQTCRCRLFFGGADFPSRAFVNLSLGHGYIYI